MCKSLCLAPAMNKAGSSPALVEAFSAVKCARRKNREGMFCFCCQGLYFSNLNWKKTFLFHIINSLKKLRNIFIIYSISCKLQQTCIMMCLPAFFLERKNNFSLMLLSSLARLIIKLTQGRLTENDQIYHICT